MKTLQLLSPCSRRARHALTLVALTTALMAGGAAYAQSYVNLTVGGQFAPGVYGQIAIGNNPPPPVINPQPVIVGTPVYGAPVMYLHVPPEHQRDWGRWCRHYNACGRPVHFVMVDPRNPWWQQRHEEGRDQRHDRGDRGDHGERGDHGDRGGRGDRRWPEDGH